MKKALAIFVLAVLLSLAAVQVVQAVESVTWGELKCLYHPRCNKNVG